MEPYSYVFVVEVSFPPFLFHPINSFRGDCFYSLFFPSEISLLIGNPSFAAKQHGDVDKCTLEKSTITSFKKLISFSFKVDVTQDDSQRRFLAQHSVAMLKQCRNNSKQRRNNVATLCCAKNRHGKSPGVTSP